VGRQVAVDIPLRQGQGMHGTFSRADTRNTMGAIGLASQGVSDDTAPAGATPAIAPSSCLLGLKGQGQR
jgi:hypothetical protein